MNLGLLTLSISPVVTHKQKFHAILWQWVAAQKVVVWQRSGTCMKLFTFTVQQLCSNLLLLA